MRVLGRDVLLGALALMAFCLLMSVLAVVIFQLLPKLALALIPLGRYLPDFW